MPLNLRSWWSNKNSDYFFLSMQKNRHKQFHNFLGLEGKNIRTTLKATFFYGVRKSRAFLRALLRNREEKGAIFKLRKKHLFPSRRIQIHKDLQMSLKIFKAYSSMTL